MKDDHFAIIMMALITAVCFATTIGAILVPALISLGPKIIGGLHALAVFSGIATFSCGGFLTVMLMHLFGMERDE